MSHFTVMIIGKNPEKQLEPFDENIDVSRYVKYTKKQLIIKGKKEIEDYKNSIYAEYLKDKKAYAKKCKNNAHLTYLANEFPLKLKWSDAEIYQDKIRWEEPENVGKNGEVYSTYNPQSKWDWYQIGGRWAGLIRTNRNGRYAMPNFSWGWEEKEKEEYLDGTYTDQAYKEDIINFDKLNIFALIKDGKWYEKGDMGWWGCVSNKKREGEWATEFKKLITDLPSDTLISIYDCHI